MKKVLQAIRRCAFSTQPGTAAGRAVLILLCCGPILLAQEKQTPKLDLAISYIGERANPVRTGGNFWLQGGGVEAGYEVVHHIGIAASFAGTHSASFGSQGIPLSLVTFAAGPRYRWSPSSEPWRKRRVGVSVFGEGLVGVAYGFDSIFPAAAGATSSASSIASLAGGGIDLSSSTRIGVRAFQASWVRTHLPNATSNVQNDLRISAGLVLRLGKRR